MVSACLSGLLGLVFANLAGAAAIGCIEAYILGLEQVVLLQRF